MTRLVHILNTLAYLVNGALWLNQHMLTFAIVSFFIAGISAIFASKMDFYLW